MTIWDRITTWCDAPAIPRIAQPIAANNIQPPKPSIAAVAEECYLRIFITEMVLGQSRAWFTDQQPSVHALSKLKFGDSLLELPAVAASDPTRFAPGNSVLANYRMLDVIPFRGGTLELEVALVAVEGDDKLGNGIKALANVAGLVSAPIAAALAVAGKVKESADMLVGDAPIHLAYHDTFTAQGGAQPLTSGFIAIIAAAPADLAGAQLVVEAQKLRLWNGDANQRAVPLANRDYLLLEIQVLPNRDDMRAFSDLADLRKATLEAFQISDDAGDRALRRALLAIKVHPELINADRRTLAEELKKDCDGLRGGGLGIAPTPVRSWDELVAAMPRGTDHAPLQVAEFI